VSVVSCLPARSRFLNFGVLENLADKERL
jgi:hypothetical protein